MESIKKRTHTLSMQRYEWLDIVRGQLAFMVVIFHALWFNGIQIWLCQSQWVVNTFIVLSGFVITMLLTRSQESYSAFIIRRVMRLAPVYLVCLGLVLLLRPLTVGTSVFDAPREQIENQHFWPLVLSHLVMLHGVVPEIILPQSSIALLPPAWSISLEMQLYFFAPLLVRVDKRGTWGLFLISLIALWQPLHWRMYGWSAIGAFVLQKGYLFLAGALIYMHVPRLGSNPVPGWLNWAIWLGKISYPLYLVHWPLMALSNSVLGGEPGLTRVYVLLIISLPPILLTSQILHLYIEKPAIKLGKQLTGSSYEVCMPRLRQGI
jgi:peptidoglycan/LPS O-acetylase OafA/YrhL